MEFFTKYIIRDNKYVYKMGLSTKFTIFDNKSFYKMSLKKVSSSKKVYSYKKDYFLNININYFNQNFTFQFF